MIFFSKLGFTPRKAEQPLQGKESQEKEDKDEKQHAWKVSVFEACVRIPSKWGKIRTWITPNKDFLRSANCNGDEKEPKDKRCLLALDLKVH